MFSIPPVPRNFDMQFSAAFDELSVYRAIGDIDDLTALAKARDDGRVVVLPCKVGDIVYALYDNGKGNQVIEEREVVEASTERVWVDSAYYDYDDIGKTVFLARAEAEAALKGAVEHETD